MSVGVLVFELAEAFCGQDQLTSRGWDCQYQPYNDNFLIAPDILKASGKEDCVQSWAQIELLMIMLGLARHDWKGAWDERACVVDH